MSGNLVTDLLDCIENEMIRLESVNDAQRQSIEIRKEAKSALNELLPNVHEKILAHFNKGQFRPQKQT